MGGHVIFDKINFTVKIKILLAIFEELYYTIKAHLPV